MNFVYNSVKLNEQLIRIINRNMRKVSKRPFIIICIICTLYLSWTYFIDTSDPISNAEKIRLIEESINSIVNQGPCRMPDIPYDSPELLAFLKAEPPLNCGDENEEWVTCEGAQCFIKKSVISEKGKVTCDFTDIIRKTDFRYKYGATSRISTTYTLKNSDFARVNCWSENNYERWNGLVAGAREKISPRKKLFNKPYYNVLMFGFDSLSKNAVKRSLPKTYKYLLNNLKADILQGYNIVGDGTPQALIPILTGYTELELPETRKRCRNTNYVNVYPMIWGEYEKQGFVTSFNEDTPNVGIFSYRLNGFNEEPTDHYLRTFYLAAGGFFSSSEKFCVGHKSSHNVMLEYTKNLAVKYKNHPNFIFSFHGELSHDSITLITLADDDIVNWFQSLEKHNILNNTILIFMSDHGNRFAEIRNTLQGKQEERLPFFSFRFPDSFKENYKNEYNNFKENTHKLTTPFDIHATLQDILDLQVNGAIQKKSKKQSRSISLLRKISMDRSCADAYIEPHWCTCLNWIAVNETSSDVITKSANALVDFINDYTKANRNICEKLFLHEINYAAKLKPHESLLKYGNSQDRDGFVPALTSTNTIINKEIYQIKVTLRPGLSIFEASVTRSLNKNKFSVKLSDISRVNKYGNQARCIYETDPELRKYCYCKN